MTQEKFENNQEPSLEAENQAEEKETSCEASILEKLTPEEIEEIAKLDQMIFPPEEGTVEVSFEELEETLKSEGVQVVLRNKDNELVGCLISLPHNQAVENLIEYDPGLKPEENALYIESIGTLPKYRSLSNLLTLLRIFARRAKERGFVKVTSHTRVAEGLSDVLQKRFGAKQLRRIEDWCKSGEPHDYLEIDIGSREV